jgi:UDP-N-acetylglucosamine--N-acetylmuramyl-(pentapeptide) pyrophosphoryl-undecaprenol N-acetylglucosamine transferase
VNVVFAGGGTGGHLYPAIAIADALRERGANVTFVGTADRLEATIVPKAGYRLETIAARPFTRKLSFELARTAFDNARGTLQSLSVLRRLRPDVIVATGGYVSFPLVLAARKLRALGLSHAAIALLEPNAQPGLTNRMLAPLVDEVWGAFVQADPRFKGKYVRTGIPVRASLRALPARDAAVTRLGLSPSRKTLLAMGGSQGARTINDALALLVKSDGLPAGWQLVHVTGEREYDRVRSMLDQEGTAGVARPAVRPYLDDLTDAYAAADLVLARAGASTLGELAAIGKPAILVPYPYAAEDHQAANAARVVAAGAAVAIADRDLDAGRLRVLLAETVAPARLAALDAAAKALQAGDPVATILARVESLAARKKPS